MACRSRRSDAWRGTTRPRRPNSSTGTSCGRLSPRAPRLWTGSCPAESIRPGHCSSPVIGPPPRPVYQELLPPAAARPDPPLAATHLARYLLENVDRTGDYQPADGQGTGRLDGHGQLAPAGERHHVRRAERGRVGEREVEIVGELRTPARRGDDRVELFGERQVRVFRRVPDARLRAASVKQPVEEGEGQDRVNRDTGADAEQICGRVRLGAAFDQVDHQPDGDEDGVRDQDEYQNA